MDDRGPRIIDGLKEALAGDLARVTIDGVTWVRADALEAAPAVPEPTEETIRYVSRYGGRCRDCADEDGVCPTSGLPCNPALQKRAISHVLNAVSYGVKHGYLAATPEAPGQAPASSPAAEPVKAGWWRYEIKYGPDGETNYAWVYDGSGALVCTAGLHHAIAIVNAMVACASSAETPPPSLASARQEGFEAGLKAAAETYRDQSGDEYRNSIEFAILALSKEGPSS